MYIHNNKIFSVNLMEVKNEALHCFFWSSFKIDQIKKGDCYDYSRYK
jgi:hypothetical protein